MYCGGVIFVDHASGFVHVEHVVNFGADEAIAAKDRFERKMATMGVVVQNYKTDNGVFTAQSYRAELEQQLVDLTALVWNYKFALLCDTITK